MSELANKTVTISVSDLQKLAYLISDIDELKGRNTVLQTLVSMAHNKIESLLGVHAHLVYDQEKI